jgi:hypothetical protein
MMSATVNRPPTSQGAAQNFHRLGDKSGPFGRLVLPFGDGHGDIQRRAFNGCAGKERPLLHQRGLGIVRRGNRPTGATHDM